MLDEVEHLKFNDNKLDFFEVRQIETGAKIEQMPLPKASCETIEFVYLHIPAENDSDQVNQEIQVLIDQAQLPENQVRIADNLNDAHPLIKKTFGHRLLNFRIYQRICRFVCVHGFGAAFR